LKEIFRNWNYTSTSGMYNKNYLSSTEIDINNAFYQNFSYSYSLPILKSVGSKIRAVRAFSSRITSSTTLSSPTIGTATATGVYGEATISFTAPTSNGGSAITSYTATSSPDGITGTVSQSGSGFITVTGLTNGTPYTFRVTSTNTAAENVTSLASNAVTPFGVPDAPTNVTAVAGNQQATVTFTAPESNGGSTITSYTATSSPDGKTGTVSQSVNGTLTVTGLTNGTTYTFTVTASNSAGTSGASSASNAVIPSTVPDPPTIGIVVSTAPGKAMVSFTAPANNGFLPITSYTATSLPEGHTGTISQDGGNGSITVTGLTQGTEYTFTITATNANGPSEKSAISTSVTSKQIALGDSYGGGKVVYIAPSDPTNPNVVHGIVSAIGNQNTNDVWIKGGSTKSTLNGNTSKVVGSGQANTTAMMAQSGFSGGAALTCSNYSVTVDGVTYDDWYLPSIDELKLMYETQKNTFNYSYYWSSSESSSSNSWFISTLGTGTERGSISGGSKDYPTFVRAARSF
jgi:hypothetical protein